MILSAIVGHKTSGCFLLESNLSIAMVKSRYIENGHPTLIKDPHKEHIKAPTIDLISWEPSPTIRKQWKLGGGFNPFWKILVKMDHFPRLGWK